MTFLYKGEEQMTEMFQLDIFGQEVLLDENGAHRLTGKEYASVVREQMMYYAPAELELQQILAVILGNVAPEVCGYLAACGIRDLANMTVDEFKKFNGIGETAASRLVAAFALAKKIACSPPNVRPTVKSPKDAAELVMEEMRYLTQEHFMCLYLNTKNELLKKQTVFIGSLNTSIVHPRECFKEAIKCSAASVICIHNHPSGQSTPSVQDIQVTYRLKEAGNVLGIELTDHIIIGDGCFYSLREKGHIK